MAGLRAREASALLFLALLILSLDGPADRLTWPVRCAAAALCLVATLDALRLRASRSPAEQAALPDTAQRPTRSGPSGLRRPWSAAPAAEAPQPKGAAWDTALVPTVQPTFAVTSSTAQGAWTPPLPTSADAVQGPLWAQAESRHREAQPWAVQAQAEDWPHLSLPDGWRCQLTPDGAGLLLGRPGLSDLRLVRTEAPFLPGDEATLCVVWTVGPDLPPEPTTTGWTVSGSPRHLVSVLEVL